jgi:hypothetical protein
MLGFSFTLIDNSPKAQLNCIPLQVSKAASGIFFGILLQDYPLRIVVSTSDKFSLSSY